GGDGREAVTAGVAVERIERERRLPAADALVARQQAAADADRGALALRHRLLALGRDGVAPARERLAQRRLLRAHLLEGLLGRRRVQGLELRRERRQALVRRRDRLILLLQRQQRFKFRVHLSSSQRFCNAGNVCGARRTPVASPQSGTPAARDSRTATGRRAA